MAPHSSAGSLDVDPRQRQTHKLRAILVILEPSDEQRRQALQSIQRFTEEEFEQDIGEMKADLLLEFMLQEIGPSVYNLAVSDAQTYLRDRLLDLEAACYYPEFTYWLPGDKKGVRRGRG